MRMNKTLLILSLILLLSVSFVSAVLDDANMYYSYNDDDITGSNPDDISGNGNDGVNDGATTGATGILGEGFSFDGINDDITTVTILDYEDETINTWFNTSYTGNYQKMFIDSGNGDIRMRVEKTTGYLNLRVGDTTVSYNTNIADGDWHMLTIVNNVTQFDAFVDGNYIGTGSIAKASASGTIIWGSDDLLRYKGNLDESSIYNRKLSPTEILSLYNSGSGFNPYAEGVSPFSVTAKDFYNGSSILTFNATIDGTLYQTTNGTIVTSLFQNDTSTYDLVVVGNGYFSETYSSIAVTSNYEAVLHQSEISFASYEYISNSSISSCNYTISGELNTTFYLSAGNYSVLVECPGYFPMNYSFNVTALDNLTVDIYDLFNARMNIDLKDVITTDLIEFPSYVTVNNNDGFLENYSFDNGSISVDLIQGNYSLTLWADNYAFKYVNVILDNLTEYFSYNLYANNSLWVTALDQNTGSSLLNFSIEVFDANVSYSAGSNNSGIIRLNNITSGVYTVRVDSEGYAVAEYALTVTGGSHQTLVGYLVTSGSTTIFTVIDSISSGIIEGATSNMYKAINSSWTLVSSQESDITGRVQYTYIPNIEYKFVIDADGYELRTFFLKPLFSSYTIRLTPDVVSVPDENTGSYLYSINNSGLFYDDQNNSFEISISSGMGTIEYYSLTATNFDGSVVSVDCVVAGGCSDSFNFEITGAIFEDVVTVEYWIKESGRSEKYFKKVYHVQDIYDPSTLEGWKDVSDDDVDSLSKAFIVMIICLIMVGFVSVGSIMVGVPPVTASGVVLALLVEVFAYVGFIPDLAGHLVALGCILILIFGRGEI